MISKEQAAELHELVESMTQIHAWQGKLLASANNLLRPAARSRSTARTSRTAAKAKAAKRPPNRAAKSKSPKPEA